MDAENKKYPGFNDESPDRDNNLKDDLDAAEPDIDDTDVNENLNFNEDDNSFELDVKSDDPDYDHPDPYNSTAKNGDDINSTYDEANPYAADEYIPNENLETDVDQLGMHIDSGKIVEVDPADEAISRTPEDDRDDLDEEGYPKNDTENFK
jgi:hypothetical protein